MSCPAGLVIWVMLVLSWTGAAVEDDEGASLQAEAVKVAVELDQAVLEEAGVAGVPYLELEGLALDPVVTVRLAH